MRVNDNGGVVIEAAINGMTRPDRNPHVPLAPEDIGAVAHRCYDLGSGLIHAHHDTWGIPAEDAARRYAAAWAPVVAERSDALWYPTIGSGPDMAAKLAHLEILCETAGLRVGLCDAGSMNLTWADDDGLPARGSGPYVNTNDDIRYALDLCDRLRIGPSIAIYEPGWLNHVLAFWRHGRLPAGSMIKLYFGGPNGYFVRGQGVSFGLPPTAKALDAYLEMLEGCPVPWSVAVMGGDVLRTPVARLAVMAGGHLHLGLEDHWSDDPGRAHLSNEEIVAEAVELVRSCGREPAGCKETAEILGLPR
jgi:3-keto-5-aminohexanoate cleavage enzyme